MFLVLRRFFFFSLLLMGTRSVAQIPVEPVNMGRVEELVDDASLKTFYPYLLERFKRFDPNLTLADYRLIYYGFAFQPAYTGYADQQKKAMAQAYAKDDYALLSRLADSVIAVVPVSLTAHYFKAYALLNLENDDAAYQRYFSRYTKLRNAVLSSGDGQQCSSAFKTIFVDDEYEIMYRYFEINVKGQQALSRSCNRYQVAAAGAYGQKEIFFDRSQGLVAVGRALQSAALK